MRQTRQAIEVVAGWPTRRRGYCQPEIRGIPGGFLGVLAGRIGGHARDPSPNRLALAAELRGWCTLATANRRPPLALATTSVACGSTCGLANMFGLLRWQMTKGLQRIMRRVRSFKTDTAIVNPETRRLFDAFERPVGASSGHNGQGAGAAAETVNRRGFWITVRNELAVAHDTLLRRRTGSEAGLGF